MKPGRYQRLKQRIVDLLGGRCVACSQAYPWFVFDLDHRDASTKLGNVSHFIQNGSLEALLAEVRKCDLLCANCHRIRTFQYRDHGAVTRAGISAKTLSYELTADDMSLDLGLSSETI